MPSSEGEILITVDIINGVRSLNRTLMRYQLPSTIIRAIEKWCTEQEVRIADANVKKG
jgi:hypothetical protein